MLPLLHYPDPRLRQVSEPLSDFNEDLHGLLDLMAITMRSERGIGLAAPQVGRFERFFVIDLGLVKGEESKLYEICNPYFEKASGSIAFEEGCLSVPGYGARVKRRRRVRLRYQDRYGKPQLLEAEGLLAVALQHENDHLDGKVFLDRLPWPLRWWHRRKARNSSVAVAF